MTLSVPSSLSEIQHDMWLAVMYGRRWYPSMADTFFTILFHACIVHASIQSLFLNSTCSSLYIDTMTVCPSGQVAILIALYRV